MDGGKKRKENFTDGEIRKLLEMFSENKDTLTSKFNNSNTNKRKMIKWREMTAAINECSSGGRTVKEVRKKWKDLLSRAKKDKTLLKKTPTGGGPLPKTSDEELEDECDVVTDTCEMERDAESPEPSCAPQEKSVTRPQAASRKRDYDELQRVLLEKEIVRVEAETAKLVTEKEKLDLEKEKIKLEIRLLENVLETILSLKKKRVPAVSKEKPSYSALFKFPVKCAFSQDPCVMRRTGPL
uniref:Myb-like domain-containing protein n=1 Tax=Neogobius melanostomus TaxID=47308 RepID=A0A8C6S8R7_9GOBI